MAYLAGDSNVRAEERKRAEIPGRGVMSQEVKEKKGTRRLAPAGIVFALSGLALFAYMVWQAGGDKIASKMQQLGAGFLIVLALSGLRFALRSYAWTLCFEAPHRLRFIDAFRAYLAGDAVGNILPLGIVVSEPTKVVLVKDRVPFAVGFSAIAVENIFYSLSVALFIIAGSLAMLASFPLPKALRWTSIGVTAGVAVFLVLALAAIRRRWKIFSGALERLSARGLGRRALSKRVAGARAIEERIYGFYERNSARFLPLILLEASFHAAGVAEAYVIIWFIGDAQPTWLAAFVLEYVNRVINVVFKSIPFRLGIDEAVTELITKVLRLGQDVGTTIGIVRKVRMLCWVVVGVGFLISRGLSVRAVARDAEQTVAAEKGVRVEGEGIRAEG